MWCFEMKCNETKKRLFVTATLTTLTLLQIASFHGKFDKVLTCRLLINIISHWWSCSKTVSCFFFFVPFCFLHISWYWDLTIQRIKHKLHLTAPYSSNNVTQFFLFLWKLFRISCVLHKKKKKNVNCFTTSITSSTRLYAIQCMDCVCC